MSKKKHHIWTRAINENVLFAQNDPRSLIIRSKNTKDTKNFILRAPTTNEIVLAKANPGDARMGQQYALSQLLYEFGLCEKVSRSQVYVILPKGGKAYEKIDSLMSDVIAAYNENEHADKVFQLFNIIQANWNMSKEENILTYRDLEDALYIPPYIDEEHNRLKREKIFNPKVLKSEEAFVKRLIIVKKSQIDHSEPSTSKFKREDEESKMIEFYTKLGMNEMDARAQVAKILQTLSDTDMSSTRISLNDDDDFNSDVYNDNYASAPLELFGTYISVAKFAELAAKNSYITDEQKSEIAKNTSLANEYITPDSLDFETCAYKFLTDNKDRFHTLLTKERYKEICRKYDFDHFKFEHLYKFANNLVYCEEIDFNKIQKYIAQKAYDIISNQGNQSFNKQKNAKQRLKNIESNVFGSLGANTDFNKMSPKEFITKLKDVYRGLEIVYNLNPEDQNSLDDIWIQIKDESENPYDYNGDFVEKRDRFEQGKIFSLGEEDEEQGQFNFDDPSDQDETDTADNDNKNDQLQSKLKSSYNKWNKAFNKSPISKTNPAGRLEFVEFATIAGALYNWIQPRLNKIDNRTGQITYSPDIISKALLSAWNLYFIMDRNSKQKLQNSTLNAAYDFLYKNQEEHSKMPVKNFLTEFLSIVGSKTAFNGVSGRQSDVYHDQAVLGLREIQDIIQTKYQKADGLTFKNFIEYYRKEMPYYLNNFVKYGIKEGDNYKKLNNLCFVNYRNETVEAPWKEDEFVTWDSFANWKEFAQFMWEPKRLNFLIHDVVAAETHSRTKGSIRGGEYQTQWKKANERLIKLTKYQEELYSNPTDVFNSIKKEKEAAVTQKEEEIKTLNETIQEINKNLKPKLDEYERLENKNQDTSKIQKEIDELQTTLDTYNTALKNTNSRLKRVRTELNNFLEIIKNPETGKVKIADEIQDRIDDTNERLDEILNRIDIWFKDSIRRARGDLSKLSPIVRDTPEELIKALQDRGKIDLDYFTTYAESESSKYDRLWWIMKSQNVEKLKAFSFWFRHMIYIIYILNNKIKNVKFDDDFLPIKIVSLKEKGALKSVINLLGGDETSRTVVSQASQNSQHREGGNTPFEVAEQFNTIFSQDEEGLIKNSCSVLVMNISKNGNYGNLLQSIRNFQPEGFLDFIKDIGRGKAIDNTAQKYKITNYRIPEKVSMSCFVMYEPDKKGKLQPASLPIIEWMTSESGFVQMEYQSFNVISSKKIIQRAKSVIEGGRTFRAFANLTDDAAIEFYEDQQARLDLEKYGYDEISFVALTQDKKILLPFVEFFWKKTCDVAAVGRDKTGEEKRKVMHKNISHICMKIEQLSDPIFFENFENEYGTVVSDITASRLGKCTRVKLLFSSYRYRGLIKYFDLTGNSLQSRVREIVNAYNRTVEPDKRIKLFKASSSYIYKNKAGLWKNGESPIPDVKVKSFGDSFKYAQEKSKEQEQQVSIS